MKAILIDSKERRVSAIELRTDPNSSLAELRERIGCDLVQPLVVGENLTLWLDEEGRLKENQTGFRLSGIGIDFAGKGILLGGDAGCMKPCKASPEVAAIGVSWLAAGAVPPPAPWRFVEL